MLVRIVIEQELHFLKSFIVKVIISSTNTIPAGLSLTSLGGGATGAGITCNIFLKLSALVHLLHSLKIKGRGKDVYEIIDRVLTEGIDIIVAPTAATSLLKL